MNNRKIQNLSVDAFEPFGDVIHSSNAQKKLSINYGNTDRYHDLANIDTLENAGRPIVNIFRSNPLPLPISIKLMERHPLSSQAFESKIEVFLADSDQGVNYHAGTWHHFSLALNSQSDFLVIDRGGEGQNCDEEFLNLPFSIHLDAKGGYAIGEKL